MRRDQGRCYSFKMHGNADTVPPISKGAVQLNKLQRRLEKITAKALTQQLCELEEKNTCADGLFR